MEYKIEVMDQGGNWYTNAMIENGFDAMQVARFYRECLGYSVKLFKGNQDITTMLDSSKFVSVKVDG